MKTTFRPSIDFKKKHRGRLYAGILVSLLLFVILFKQFSFEIVSGPILYLLKPFLAIDNRINRQWQELKSIFESKSTLENEIAALRIENARLEARLALSEVAEKEVEILKKAFSTEEKQNFILGSIIFRPPHSPYDTFIVDSGSYAGIKEGMPVLAFENILLGYAVDVSADIAKVKLVSSFGEETNVLLEDSGNPAIAVGMGGENLEIKLPRAVSVSEGERIITFGKRPMFIGTVSKIERRDTDPFQKIIFRLPVNLQYLSSVFFLKK